METTMLIKKLAEQPFTEEDGKKTFTREGKILIHCLAKACSGVKIDPREAHSMQQELRGKKTEDIYFDLLSRIATKTGKEAETEAAMMAPIIDRRLIDEMPKIISDPKFGWCNFDLDSFQGTPSYMTDVPMDLMKCFQDWINNGIGAAYLDEEGTDFIVNITNSNSYIIEENQFSHLHMINKYDPMDLLGGLLHSLKKDKDAWAAWLPDGATPERKKAFEEKYTELAAAYEQKIDNECRKIVH